MKSGLFIMTGKIKMGKRRLHAEVPVFDKWDEVFN